MLEFNKNLIVKLIDVLKAQIIYVGLMQKLSAIYCI